MPNKEITEETIDELQTLINEEKSHPAQNRAQRDLNLCLAVRRAFTDFVDFNTWYSHRQDPAPTAERLIQTITDCMELTKDSQSPRAGDYQASIEQKLRFVTFMRNGGTLHQAMKLEL